MMKKLISVLLIFSMVLGMGACAKKPSPENAKEKTALATEEGVYPIHWQGKKIYSDPDAWNADYETVSEYVKNFEQYRGKLNTAEGLYGYIASIYDEDFLALYHHLQGYAYYGMYAFPSNSDYQRCIAKLNLLEQEITDATAYFDEEMAGIGLEKRKALFDDPRLQSYAYAYRDYLKEDTVFLSERETLLQNQLNISRGRMESLYNLLAYADLSDLEYTLPSGEVITIDDTSLLSYLYGDYDIQTKLDIYDAWWGHTAELKNSFAYALETEMLEEYADAKIAGYDSTLQWALSDIGISEKVMTMLLDAAHEGAEKHAEYFRIYANRDQTEEYYTFSEYKPISGYDFDTLQYDDGVDLVMDALGILGDDYVQTFKEIVSSGFVDVYPQEDKAGGAFELGGYAGLHPFVMFNYDGSMDSVATIAHEMGHACYSELAMENQAPQAWDMGIFTQEVASITNELLFYNYLIEHAQSDEEKLFYIESILTTWTGSFFRQCFFQEFENDCHELVESGNILDPEDLKDKWEELSKIYYGEGIRCGEMGGYRWTTLDHLYYNHYVFQYATSVCYASAIAQRILNGEEGAAESYLAFLKAGDSASPGELLKIAGIDIEDEGTYEKALDYFYGLMDEFEFLAKEMYR